MIFLIYSEEMFKMKLVGVCVKDGAVCVYISSISCFSITFQEVFFQFKIVTFGTSKMCALWNRKSNEICIIQPNVPESVKCTENFVVFVFDQSNLKQNAYLKWIRALIN